MGIQERRKDGSEKLVGKGRSIVDGRGGEEGSEGWKWNRWSSSE